MPLKRQRQDQKKVRKGRTTKRSAKRRGKYAGKKKRFVNKTQVVVNAHIQEVLCVDYALGACHDFKLYKQSKIRIHPQIKLKTDSGYLGVKRLHPNSELPKRTLNLKSSPKSRKDTIVS